MHQHCGKNGLKDHDFTLLLVISWIGFNMPVISGSILKALAVLLRPNKYFLHRDRTATSHSFMSSPIQIQYGVTMSICKVDISYFWCIRKFQSYFSLKNCDHFLLARLVCLHLVIRCSCASISLWDRDIEQRNDCTHCPFPHILRRNQCSLSNSWKSYFPGLHSQA